MTPEKKPYAVQPTPTSPFWWIILWTELAAVWLAHARPHGGASSALDEAARGAALAADR
jgi:hypothetical protein